GDSNRFHKIEGVPSSQGNQTARACRARCRRLVPTARVWRTRGTQLLNFGSIPNSRRLQSPPWCSAGATDPGPTLFRESTRIAPVFGLHSVPVALDRRCAERREY